MGFLLWGLVHCNVYLKSGAFPSCLLSETNDSRRGEEWSEAVTSLQREQYSVIPVIPKSTNIVKTFRISTTFFVKYRINITNRILTIILSKIHIFDNFPRNNMYLCGVGVGAMIGGADLY